MAPAPVQAPTRAPSRMAPAPIGQRSEDPYTSEAMANVFEWLRSGDPRGAFEPPVPAPSLASRAVEFLPERFREPVRSAGRAFEESPAGSALRMVASRDPSELMADVAGGPLIRSARAAKAARAQAGFDPRTFYHGSADWSEVDRAGAFLPTDRYSGALLPEFRTSSINPIYLTDKKSVAKTYVDKYGRGTENAGVRGFAARMDNPLVVQTPWYQFDQIPIDVVQKAIPESRLDDFESMVRKYRQSESNLGTASVSRIARDLGYDSVEFKGLIDTLHGGWNPKTPHKFASDVIALFSPEQLRYPTAAFDPAKRDSADLLAGIALPALFTGGAVANQRRKREDQ
jgi:hypothetical protein